MSTNNSPPHEPTVLPSGNAPPTPPFSPRAHPLDDIYGSAPSSPVLSPHAQEYSHHTSTHLQTHEILSDLPSRQRALDTDAYREGLSNSKGQYVQEGFDEGYALGANLGQRVGYILGVFEGMAMALRGNKEENQALYRQAKGWWESAQRELAIQELLGQKWVDGEGIWRWEVRASEEGEEPTLREVAEQHPCVRRWMGRVEEVAREWGVDLRASEGGGG
ncbi:uncharacterized protein EI97DRAFT_86263 [Westerdykella ornata]|uniref:Protein YAE1 n=1 Tax=Westerdykella ornata TaxID=318751 RepID=A0A6A6JFX5_WESOR|nr:uncharacterized protein EI97DRAFT_86263 [Westerdykella ornata]KAF2275053.1 hypothetical protein EI97DRAFT_86263 [Westerdykella ornata]